MSVMGNSSSTSATLASEVAPTSPVYSSKRCDGFGALPVKRFGDPSQAQETTLPPFQSLASPKQLVKSPGQLLPSGADGAKFKVLGKSLRNNCVPSSLFEACRIPCNEDQETNLGIVGDCSPDSFAGQGCVSPSLPQDSPYIGSERHVPPSPLLSFFQMPPALDPNDLFTSLTEDVAAEEEPPKSEEQLVSLQQRLPIDVWATIFSSIVGVPSLKRWLYVARGFPEILRSAGVWRNNIVRIAPGMLQALAPRLSLWLPSWRCASKVSLPNSTQMLAEVARRAPDLPVEVAWRFSEYCKGAGVEIHRHGCSVRRRPTATDELVVVGDAPIARGLVEGGASNIRVPYFEVRLDQLDMQPSANPNDFGLGVTVMHPKRINHEQIAVADEVPRSWIVDFTRSTVCLTKCNEEIVRGQNLSVSSLVEGDRVGLRFVEDAVEIFVNGVLRERLVPDVRDRVPLKRDLFPVLDLYGRTIQVSRVDVEAPLRVLHDS
eukprot:TRINITY_DN9435_c0_g1_i2.p1 TRINITY_DN9435_c0_g1~~TRINITY_DN9435_c0_g1_i2.p1  ORF type:complete len:489 (-),score=88.96 TRINITY_DN9435_c0_g1_i2:128-1594(-)